MAFHSVHICPHITEWGRGLCVCQHSSTWPRGPSSFAVADLPPQLGCVNPAAERGRCVGPVFPSWPPQIPSTQCFITPKLLLSLILEIALPILYQSWFPKGLLTEKMYVKVVLWLRTRGGTDQWLDKSLPSAAHSLVNQTWPKLTNARKQCVRDASGGLQATGPEKSEVLFYFPLIFFGSTPSTTLSTCSEDPGNPVGKQRLFPFSP